MSIIEAAPEGALSDRPDRVEGKMSSQPELPRDQRSQVMRRRLRAVVEAHHRNRMEMAELFSEVEAEDFWRDWGYPDFRSCIKQEYRLSPSTTRELIAMHRTLVDRLHLPPERVRQLEWSKAVLVTRLVTPENADAILQDVERLSYRDLKRKYKPASSPEVLTATLPATAGLEGVSPEADWRRPKPPEDEFYIPAPQWDALCYAQHFNEHAILLGHAGCGKTEVASRVAQAFAKELVPFNCGAMTEARTALIGNTHLDRANGTWFQPSRFVAAVQNPRACVLLDELSRAPRDAFNILLPVLDHQRYLALDESADGDLVRVAAGVTFLATANLGAAYTGADPLDEALKDRFPVILAMDFPPPEQEAAILRKRCPGLSEPDARHLVRFAGRQRELAGEGEFTALISTRSLLAAARQTAAGVARADAVEVAILNRFPADGGDASDRTKLLQLLQKFKS